MRTIHKGENCTFLEKNKSSDIIKEISLSESRYNKSQTIKFDKPVVITGRMSVAGKKEGDGPIGKHIPVVYEDLKLGEKSFEKAEIAMLKEAVENSIRRAGKRTKDIDLFIAGDLLNQITSSSYAARELDIPYMGVYSACSTSSQAYALGASLISAGYYDNIVCATSSHFATAERQFRFPLEYGCQRPAYSQWTVTGAGSTVLSSSGDGPKIKFATMGRVVDFGTNDLNNLGAAMAPAAHSTLTALFKDTNTKPSDYDLIVTGDLGKLGSDILRDLMKEGGLNLAQNYVDCGCLIYDHNQTAYQGGSGSGCSATVMNSFILDKMESGEYNRIIFAATGALMSSQSCFQGETIPCISHAVIIEN